MYKSYEFIFAGMPSSMYGLMVCDFAGKSHSDHAFGNKASIIDTRIPGRIKPLHHGVDYHSSPLEFSLVFGSDRELDRWEMEEVANWLTGHKQYQWLSIEQPDLDHIEFRCLITKLTPISVGWIPYAFEAEVVCDCPYAYGHRFEETFSFSDGSTIYLANTGNVREFCVPELTFRTASGCSAISITNLSDIDSDGNKRVFSLTGIPASGAVIHIDGENCIIIDETYGTNLYDGFNDNFFRLVPGDNVLTMTGAGTMTIAGRFYHNVGA